VAQLTLGSFNLHMGRGSGGHDAPFYDVVTACKHVDTDVLVLQEAWVPDGEDGDLLSIAGALGYQIAASFAVARATCDDRVRLVARSGTAGDGDWQVAILSRLPVVSSAVVPLEPQLPRDPARRALLVVTVDVGGTPFTVCGTHLPVLKDPVWRLRRSLRRALPPPDRPAALVGDMNMWGWSVELLVGGGASRRRGWRRAVRGRTYPAHRPHSQTDHILVTRPVDVLDAEVVPLVRSDHRPVRALLQL
jgi:endonuclease/exonuclease/phosphatase family metal-dependent hydrolase